MVQLSFESNVVSEVVTGSERWTVAQINVFEDAMRVRVDVLVAEERANVGEPSGNLGIERRHIEYGSAGLERVPNKKAFIKEFDAMSHIDHVGIDARVADPDGRWLNESLILSW